MEVGEAPKGISPESTDPSSPSGECYEYKASQALPRRNHWIPKASKREIIGGKQGWGCFLVRYRGIDVVSVSCALGYRGRAS